MKLKASKDNVSLLCFVFILDFGNRFMNKRFHCTEPLMAVPSVFPFPLFAALEMEHKKKKERTCGSVAAVIDYLVSGLFP